MVKNSTDVEIKASTPFYQDSDLVYPIKIVIDDNLYRINNRNGHYFAPEIDRNPVIKYIERT